MTSGLSRWSRTPDPVALDFTSHYQLPKMASTSQTPSVSRDYTGLVGLIRRVKDWVESLAEKPYALVALFFLALIESIFFPIPVDVLLIALCVSQPRKSLLFATVCTLGSVVGGVTGYGVGYWMWYDAAGEFSSLASFFFNHVPGFTVDLFNQVGARYADFAIETVFTASFTPIPYKLVTISAGVFQINLLLFMIVSLAGRAARFFLVAILFYFFGEQIKGFIDKYLGLLSIAFVILLIGGLVAIRFFF